MMVFLVSDSIVGKNLFYFSKIHLHHLVIRAQFQWPKQEKTEHNYASLFVFRAFFSTGFFRISIQYLVHSLIFTNMLIIIPNCVPLLWNSQPPNYNSRPLKSVISWMIKFNELYICHNSLNMCLEVFYHRRMQWATSHHQWTTIFHDLIFLQCANVCDLNFALREYLNMRNWANTLKIEVKPWI